MEVNILIIKLTIKPEKGYKIQLNGRETSKKNKVSVIY